MAQRSKTATDVINLGRLVVSKRETRVGTTIAFVAWTLAVYDHMLFGTILPELSAEFGWDAAAASGITTAIAVGTFIVMLAVGPVVDRLGRRRGMMVTVGGPALASGLTALTFSPFYLVGVRSIGGLGMAEQSVNATYLNEIYSATEDKFFKKHRGQIYALVQSGWPLGVFLAALFAALLLPVVGWRGVFLIATFPAIALLIIRSRLKETPQYLVIERARRLRKEGDEETAKSLLRSFNLDEEQRAPLRTIFSKKYRRNTTLLTLVWISNFFAVVAFTVLGTTLLVEGKGIPFDLSLVIFMVANLGGFVGYQIFGYLGQKFGRRNVTGAGFIIAGLAYVGLLFVAQDTISIMAFYAIGQACMAGPFAAFMFYMGEAYDADCRATGTTFLNAMSQPGTIIGGVVMTALLASGVGIIMAALLVGVTGCVVSGLLMFACKNATELADFTPREEVEVTA
ncbi:MFS transporter [Microbacterium foliorum]|uniref:MFS transporter n=1 Tax=Microbacterium foliorum TaxID=104336 RepID=UPI001DF5F866|nr:MFS transporter [Microbacterium foliorum]CAH0177098.1 Putative niacin/nicotinamide transporter NaiP [Microbacterium foliorum]CAH0206628.1 Putative niacin/nicotinamide transporter NaiP [Microbacterium foliorum]